LAVVLAAVGELAQAVAVDAVDLLAHGTSRERGIVGRRGDDALFAAHGDVLQSDEDVELEREREREQAGAPAGPCMSYL
jgi:hypothetical protein